MQISKTMRARLGLRWIALFAGVIVTSPAVVAHAQSWPVDGANIFDWRYQPSENVIGPNNAASLAPQWVFNSNGDVSATPTSQDNVVYFPDWAGYLYAVNANTGQLIWER